jgi:hypothetical protein
VDRIASAVRETDRQGQPRDVRKAPGRRLKERDANIVIVEEHGRNARHDAHQRL